MRPCVHWCTITLRESRAWGKLAPHAEACRDGDAEGPIQGQAVGRMTNMGTTSSPEGLPHYLTKHFLAQRLGKCLRDDVGFWFCFVEQCNACDGGFVIENILEGVRRIEYETPFLGYQPDILLWGKSEEKPLRAVEVVATSEPSAGKRRMFKEQGVDLYIRAVPHGGASSSRQAVHRRLLHTAGGRPSLLPAQGEEEAERVP